MRKLLALLSAGLVVAAMSGCGLSPTATPTITIDPIGSIARPASNSVTKSVTGKVEAGDAITAISYDILNSNDVSVSTGKISVSGPAANSAKELDFNGNLIITVYSTADTGTFKLKISVTGGSSTDQTFAFTVTGTGGTAVTESATLTLGAQYATPPSLLDADNMTIYSNSNTSLADQARTDAIFSYSTVISALAFTSPDVAQGSPYDTWTNLPSCQYKAVTATWSNINTQQDINTLWGTGAGSSRLAINQGDIIIIKTSDVVYKAVEILSINTSGGTGGYETISIKGKY